MLYLTFILIAIWHVYECHQSLYKIKNWVCIKTFPFPVYDLWRNFDEKPETTVIDLYFLAYCMKVFVDLISKFYIWWYINFCTIVPLFTTVAIFLFGWTIDSMYWLSYEILKIRVQRVRKTLQYFTLKAKSIYNYCS